MFIIEVIPIAKSVRVPTLSYFSAKEIVLGSLVTVPVRKKELQAVVVSISKLEDLKSIVKSANYQLRNVLEIHDEQLFDPRFFTLAVDLASYYATDIGVMLDTLLMKSISKRFNRFSTQKKNSITPIVSIPGQKQLLQRGKGDRLQYYRVRSREALASGTSLYICCPTIEACESIYEYVSQGIPEQCFVLHSKKRITSLEKDFNKINSSESPSILIGTPRFLSWSRNDTCEFIIEASSSSSYLNITQPHIDFRIAVEHLAELYHADCTYADKAVDIATWKRVSEGELNECEPTRHKVLDPKKLTVLEFTLGSTKQSEQDRLQQLKHESSGFHPLHHHAMNVLVQGLKEHKNIVIFVPKKGRASHMVCQDCGRIAISETSKRPYSLYHKKNKETGVKEAVYVCNATGEQIPAFDVCQTCKGTNLKEMGITTGSIYKHLINTLPASKIHILDAQNTKTKKELNELHSQWNNHTGMVVIGTSKILSSLSSWDLCIVSSLSSMLSIMSFQNEERIIHLLTSLQEKTIEHLYLQDRSDQLKHLRVIQEGMYPDFVTQELKLRKELGYPPFNRLIKIRINTNRSSLNQQYQRLKSSLHKYNPEILIQPHTKTQVFLVVLITIETKQWNLSYQDPWLNEYIHSLDRNADCEIDPSKLS